MADSNSALRSPGNDRLLRDECSWSPQVDNAGRCVLELDKQLVLARFLDGREGPARQIVVNMGTISEDQDGFFGSLAPASGWPEMQESVGEGPPSDLLAR